MLSPGGFVALNDCFEALSLVVRNSALGRLLRKEWASFGQRSINSTENSHSTLVNLNKLLLNCKISDFHVYKYVQKARQTQIQSAPCKDRHLLYYR